MEPPRSSDLTTGELLLVDRRRRGESQREAARRLGVSRYRYRRAEADLEPGPRRPRIERLRPHEGCLVLRRREGLSVRELADLLGLSRWWVTQMERGGAPSDRLEAHWAARSEKIHRAACGGRRAG